MIRRASGPLVAILIFTAACEKKGAEVATPAKPLTVADLTPTSRKAPVAEAKPRNPDLERIVKLSLQADQIAREAWWVATGEKLGLERSPFGKLKRAFQLVLDGKLSTKGRFACDRYLVMPLPGPLKNFEVSEICQKSGPRRLAAWRVTGPSAAQVEFEPANLTEVLGLGASIFSKRFTCELSWSASDILERLSCPKWEQDRGGGQVLSWQKFEFTRSGKSLLSLRGQILENLQAVRKIEAEVPLEGKILVTETEMQAPRDEQKPPPETKKAGTPVGKPPAPLPPPDPNAQLYQGPSPELPPPEMIPIGDGGVYIPPVIPEPPPARRAVDPDLMRQQGTLPPPVPPEPAETTEHLSPGAPPAVDPGGQSEYSPNPEDSGGGVHGQESGSQPGR